MENFNETSQNNKKKFSTLSYIYITIVIVAIGILTLQLVNKAPQEPEVDIIIGKWALEAAHNGDRYYDDEAILSILDISSMEFRNDFSGQINHQGRPTTGTWEFLTVKDDVRVYSFGGIMLCIDTNPNSPLFNRMVATITESDMSLIFVKE